MLLEEPADASGERLHHLVAVLAGGAHVERDVARVHAELTAVAELAEHVCRTQHRLCGDAGDVEAPPADEFTLDDRSLHAQLGGANRGDVASGAGADHDDVVLISHSN